MYCPVCHCEYVAAATVCSDCQVDLVPELPSENPNEAPNRSSDDTPWVLLWSGGDPRRREDLCAVLEDEQIPARTSLEGGLLGLGSSFDIYVPAPLVSKAQEVLRQIALSEEEWQRSGAAVRELPAEEAAATSDASERPAAWYPEDVTSQIWSGANRDLALMIEASLRENMIPFRTDPDEAALEDAPESSRSQQIFVLPEDEARAKEIVRQIVDAVAP